MKRNWAGTTTEPIEVKGGYKLPHNADGIVCDRCKKGVKSVGVVCGQFLCAPCEAKVTGVHF